jgi:dimethylhistidine N-methyltransferase
MARSSPEVNIRNVSAVQFQERLYLENMLNPQQSNDTDEAQEIITGLTQSQKYLSPRYLYDDLGSQLFEQICDLPEYYPTRTETAILQQYSQEIAQATGISQLVEVGSGSSTKTRLLLDAYQKLDYPLYYIPIDVSASILEASSHLLLADYPNLKVHGLIATYELALQCLAPTSLPSRTICFLGSTIGNFTQSECDRFFSQVTNGLEKGDYFLLGFDLQKPIQIIEAAYNDSQGVTAAFNLNALNHLNRLFQGNFNLNLFKHWAFYNQSKAQIEMHLISQAEQSVRLDALDLDINFFLGETILTEISRKFTLERMKEQLQAHGLKTIQVWTDPNEWFSLCLTQLI